MRTDCKLPSNLSNCRLGSSLGRRCESSLGRGASGGNTSPRRPTLNDSSCSYNTCTVPVVLLLLLVGGVDRLKDRDQDTARLPAGRLAGPALPSVEQNDPVAPSARDDPQNAPEQRPQGSSNTRDAKAKRTESQRAKGISQLRQQFITCILRSTG